VDLKNETKKKRQKPPKELLECRLLTRKVNCLSREPPVLANQPREMTVTANLGQLINQHVYRIVSSEKCSH
jgi:hypothetical protein